jgi:hypothetical protein
MGAMFEPAFDYRPSPGTAKDARSAHTPHLENAGAQTPILFASGPGQVRGAIEPNMPGKTKRKFFLAFSAGTFIV